MPNYAIKPTPEQALGTNRTQPPARLIAALAIRSEIGGIAADCRRWNRCVELNAAAFAPALAGKIAVALRATAEKRD